MRRRKDNLSSAFWRDSALETGGFADLRFDTPSKRISRGWYVFVLLCVAVSCAIARQQYVQQMVIVSVESFKAFEEDEICKLSNDSGVPYVHFRDGSFLLQPRITQCEDMILKVEEVCASGEVVTAKRCATVQVEHLTLYTPFFWFERKHSLFRDTKAVCLQHWVDVMQKRICLKQNI